MTTQSPSHHEPLSKKTATLALIPLGVLINFALGNIVHLLHLPIFVDVVGTIIVTITIGWVGGAITGILSSILGAVIGGYPVLIWFSGTQVVIAIVTGLCAARGGFRTVPRAVISGALIGVGSATPSALVIINFLGYVTDSGTGLLTGALIAKGVPAIPAVFMTGFFFDPLDKILSALLVFWLLRTLPLQFRARLDPLAYLKLQDPSLGTRVPRAMGVLMIAAGIFLTGLAINWMPTWEHAMKAFGGRDALAVMLLVYGIPMSILGIYVFFDRHSGEPVK